MNKRLDRREDHALRLYVEGLNYSEVSRELDVTPSAARAMISRAMRKNFAPLDDVDEWRKEKVAQLEVLIDRLWKFADDEKTASAIIRAIDKQADLMGIAKMEVHTVISIEQVREYRDQLVEQLQLVKGEIESTHDHADT